jgi:hypothetical protein
MHCFNILKIRGVDRTCSHCVLLMLTLTFLQKLLTQPLFVRRPIGLKDLDKELQDSMLSRMTACLKQQV